MAVRTFVGFSPNMEIADFESAAFEAERISSLVQARLCALWEARGADGGLRAALDAGAQLEIAAIQFTRDDAGAAEVHVKLAREAMPAPADRSEPNSAWVLTFERDADGYWRLVP